MDDDDDDDDEEEEDDSSTEEKQLLAAAAIAASTTCIEQLYSRAPFDFVRDRLCWQQHAQELVYEDRFHCNYRMSLESFTKLCDLIRPVLQLDEEMSRRATGKDPISVEIMLHCLLRFLGGSSYHCIRIIAGISEPSFYRIVYKCARAILSVNELEYHFPETEQEISDAASNFAKLSGPNLVRGCVGCIDGLLLRITAPRARDAQNGKAYYSGHYRDFGINVQAICDSHCRFIFAALAAPGGTNDITAYRKTSIVQRIKNLPIGRYVIGDNAYICTEHLLTPFSGDEKKDVMKDGYNFHLSQVRIRIEMTFGQFINKWRYFGRPSQLSLKNHGMLFMCATRLHNFCINERLLEQNGFLLRGTAAAPPPDDPDEPLLVPPVGVEEEIAAPEQVDTVQHMSMMRQILLDKVIAKNLVRPAYNKAININNN